MKKSKVTISVMGSSGVGKTALSTRFLSNEFSMEHDPTGFHSLIHSSHWFFFFFFYSPDYYQSSLEIDSKIINLQIIDTAGQDGN
jgi:GTPase SAR1 family protein